ncbi:Fanconi anemia group J protein [Massospora cicadina]|nr:Fanconi anemia group J protein [Massospora cicadina]
MALSQTSLEDLDLDIEADVDPSREAEVDAYKPETLTDTHPTQPVNPLSLRAKNAAKRFKGGLCQPKVAEPSTYPPTQVFETLVLSGVEVKFPYVPYPSQLTIMSKVIQAVQTAKCALLESPTAWQTKEKDRLLALKETKREATDNLPKPKPHLPQVAASTGGSAPSLNPATAAKVVHNVSGAGNLPSVIESDEDDFRPQPSSSQSEVRKVDEGGQESSTTNRRPRFPVIYYGTRTHKQIQQVVEELRSKTPTASTQPPGEANLEEACSKLCDQTRKANPWRLDGALSKLRTVPNNQPDGKKGNASAGKPSFNLSLDQPDPSSSDAVPKDPNLKDLCPYQAGTATMFHKMDSAKFLSTLRREGPKEGLTEASLNSPIWDIEDLVLAGKKAVGCPYYAARELAAGADVIFCPYNYLLYPSIREAMNIHLEGNVFIIDEAHNLEETAREAASLELTGKTLEFLEGELGELGELGRLKHEILPLRALVIFIRQFANDRTGYVRSQEDLDRKQYIWNTPKFWESLEPRGIGPDSLPKLTAAMAALKAHKKYVEDKDPGATMPTLSDLAERELGSLLFVLQSLCRFPKGYMVAVVTAPSHDNSATVTTLGFWCLDSGVIFHDFFKQAHAILLTSGTLSPLSTFSSELSAEFSLRYEGDHIIQPHQVWAGAVAVGPRGTKLYGKFATTQTLEYQDAVGDAILKVAQKVPGGLLCFLPSYLLLEKFLRRWRLTKAFDALNAVKRVLIEPKDNGAPFDKILKAYRTLCADAGQGTGPLLFGVFRGKLSEGIDFRDSECRCVISVGIPYPHLKDLKVTLKREFNDRNQNSRGLMSGADWYTTQAYRAINQAVGRCIRHKDDWGAIVLLDERFAMAHHYTHLSKWVVKFLAFPKTFDEAIASLGSFIGTKDKPLTGEDFHRPKMQPDRMPNVPNRTPSDFKEGVAFIRSPIQVCRSSYFETNHPNQLGSGSNVSCPGLEKAKGVDVPIPKPAPGSTRFNDERSALQAWHRPLEIADGLMGAPCAQNLHPHVQPAHNLQPSTGLSNEPAGRVEWHPSGPSTSINQAPQNLELQPDLGTFKEEENLPVKLPNDARTLACALEQTLYDGLDFSDDAEAFRRARETSLLTKQDPPYQSVACTGCNRLLSLTLAPAELPAALSRLSFPARYLPDYSPFSGNLSSGLTPISTTSLWCGGMPANAFYDPADRLIYGYFGCVGCSERGPGEAALPLVVKISGLADGPNLPPGDTTWLWVHPTLATQLKWR